MFEDREDAAKKLTLKLLSKIKSKHLLVVAIPRGAVIMGRIIAEYFNAPFDIAVFKKLGAPNNPELAIGVVGPKDTIIWNNNIVKELGLSKQEQKIIRQKKEDERDVLELSLRSDIKPVEIKGKTIILVDDGVATGATVMAARSYLLKEGAIKIILATPVIAKESFRKLKKSFDKIVTLRKPESFFAVGQYYRSFPQVENNEVIDILKNRK